MMNGATMSSRCQIRCASKIRDTDNRLVKELWLKAQDSKLEYKKDAYVTLKLGTLQKTFKLGVEKLIQGTSGRRHVDCRSGHEEIFAGRGDDIIIGNRGNDVLNGATGHRHAGAERRF